MVEDGKGGKGVVEMRQKTEVEEGKGRGNEGSKRSKGSEGSRDGSKWEYRRE